MLSGHQPFQRHPDRTGLPAGRNDGPSRSRSERSRAARSPRRLDSSPDPGRVSRRRTSRPLVAMPGTRRIPAPECAAWFSAATAALLGHAQAWDMSWFGRRDSRSRIGLISLEVSADHVVKATAGSSSQRSFAARERTTSTSSQSKPRRPTRRRSALYASLGFRQVEEATCFRLPRRHRLFGS